MTAPHTLTAACSFDDGGSYCYGHDTELYPGRYRVAGWPGVAWWVDGPELGDDADTEWTGEQVPTGRVTAVMVGDDRRHSIEVDDLSPLDESDYCAECGQVGCTADGRDR